MNWLRALEHLRATRQAGVLVTLTDVRGHAPRAGGAKMVVSADATWDSIGGGNLEEVAVREARALIADGATTPVTRTTTLSDRAPYELGVQCCGGEVSVLLEPLPVVASVAVFGVGHVGLELARVLARHDLDLHLVDSRPEQLTPARLAPLDDAIARVHVHPVKLLPELVLGELPAGSHVLVMTHDHAEDYALCDAALRSRGPGAPASIGLIGSSSKWARFSSRLAADGHGPDDLARVTTPIGIAGLAGKDPATIAVGVAAALLAQLESDVTSRKCAPDRNADVARPTRPSSASAS